MSNVLSQGSLVHYLSWQSLHLQFFKPAGHDSPSLYNREQMVFRVVQHLNIDQRIDIEDEHIRIAACSDAPELEIAKHDCCIRGGVLQNLRRGKHGAPDGELQFS